VTFSATYDGTTKVVTLLVFIAAIGAAVASHNVPITFILFLGICLSYAYSPRGYVCEGKSLIAKRLAGDVSISLEGLRELRAATREDFRGCRRLWGNGGLFGYYGLFRTARLGKCTWYVTNRRNVVVVATDSKTVLVSPDDVPGFLETIRTLAPVSSGISAPAAETPSPADKLRPIGMVLGAVVGIAVLAFVLFAVLYSPGLPKYTLGAEDLAIHDFFYPVTVRAAAVDIERVRVVDLGVDADWRPTQRTNGFSNSHYHSGWYRVVNGEKVRMYRADGTRLVLLPPKGTGVAVLLEVTEPDRFVEQVRALWSRR
jgi:Bacterial PH domain